MKPSIISLIIIGLLAILYTISAYPEFSSANPAFLDLISIYKKAIISHNEYWRFITGPLFHLNWGHLLANCFSFYIFSSLLSSSLKTKEQLVVIGITWFFSVLLSFINMPENTASIGFSGVCFGLEGVYFAFVLCAAFKQELAFFFKQIYGVLIYIALTAGYYYFNPYSDNWAHIGGFISGLVTGVMLYTIKTKDEPVN